MIAENIARVRERMQRAAERAGRSASEITLVAVTKTVDVARIEEAVRAGARDLGENYVQEAREKQAQIDSDVRWHFIGHLQTNKVKYVAGRFALVHSVDSEALARELGRRSQTAAATQDVLVEVKLDETATKFGSRPEEALDLAGKIADMPGLRLRGLMGMAPFVDEPEQARPYFACLRELFERLPVEHREILSMGMTADFEVAIEEGSTLVRIGTAIFGRRQT